MEKITQLSNQIYDMTHTSRTMSTPNFQVLPKRKKKEFFHPGGKNQALVESIFVNAYHSS